MRESGTLRISGQNGFRLKLFTFDVVKMMALERDMAKLKLGSLFRVQQGLLSPVSTIATSMATRNHRPVLLRTVTSQPPLSPCAGVTNNAHTQLSQPGKRSGWGSSRDLLFVLPTQGTACAWKRTLALLSRS